MSADVGRTIQVLHSVRYYYYIFTIILCVISKIKFRIVIVSLDHHCLFYNNFSLNLLLIECFGGLRCHVQYRITGMYDQTSGKILSIDTNIYF